MSSVLDQTPTNNTVSTHVPGTIPASVFSRLCPPPMMQVPPPPLQGPYQGLVPGPYPGPLSYPGPGIGPVPVNIRQYPVPMPVFHNQMIDAVAQCRTLWVKDTIEYQSQCAARRDGFVRDLLRKNKRLRNKNVELLEENKCLNFDLMNVQRVTKRVKVTVRDPTVEDPEMVRARTEWEETPADTKDELIVSALAEIKKLKLEGIIRLEENARLAGICTDCKKLDRFRRMIPAAKKLVEMVGIEPIKDQVFRMMCFFAQGLQSGEELNHIMITGEPGTGKTELAKILAEVFLSTGHLKGKVTDKSRGDGTGPGFRIIKRSDLVGEYLGQTAVKTQELLDSMAGGVIIFDEAYQLGHERHGDSYSKESIDCICQNLTLGNFLMIIAGYESSIRKCLFGANRGLERRFTQHFEMKKYSARELKEIFERKAHVQGWVVRPDAITVKDFERNKGTFKNQGGDVVHLLDKCKVTHSLLALEDRETRKEITREDFLGALEKFVELRPAKDESWRHLYM